MEALSGIETISEFSRLINAMREEVETVLDQLKLLSNSYNEVMEETLSNQCMQQLRDSVPSTGVDLITSETLSNIQSTICSALTQCAEMIQHISVSPKQTDPDRKSVLVSEMGPVVGKIVYSLQEQFQQHADLLLQQTVQNYCTNAKSEITLKDLQLEMEVPVFDKEKGGSEYDFTAADESSVSLSFCSEAYSNC